MCQYRFVNYIIRNVPPWCRILKEILCVGRARSIRKLSVPSAQFFCKPKTALKNEVCVFKIHMKMKGTKIAETTLIKNKYGEVTLKTY